MMATYRVGNLPDGSTQEVDLPPDATEDQIIAEAMKKVSAKSSPTVASGDQVRKASSISGVWRGVTDPFVAAGQLFPRAVSAVSSLGGFLPNSFSDRVDSLIKMSDDAYGQDEAAYQDARKAVGKTGLDTARLVGNVFSPANAAFAAMPLGATTTMGRIGAGALGGGAGGAMTPVWDTSSTSFAGQKAGQIGVGAMAGSVFAPVVGKAVDIAAPRIAALFARFKDPIKAQVQASVEANQAISAALAEAGIEESMVSPQVRQQVVSQIIEAAKNGKAPDAAALVRKADFDSVGIPYMLPQITRDPAQFSQMMNLRGVALPGGEPNPIQEILRAQNQAVTQKVGALGGLKAADPVIAGRGIVGALKEGDEIARRGVSAAYTAARGSAEAAADVPMPGLAQRAGEIVDNFGIGGEPNALPTVIANKLKSYGFIADDGMVQRKLFDFNEADKLIKLINAHDNKGGNAALAQLRSAVKEAMTNSPKGVADPFAPARAAAKARFDVHDAVPALDLVAKASTPEELSRVGDDFVQKFIINAKPSDVKQLAKILPKDQFDEARKQVARAVYQKVFGMNAAGDKAARAESFQTGLNQIGVEKLRVFFSAKEVEELQSLARVVAFMSQDPAASTVSRGSNIGGAMFNQLIDLASMRGPLSATFSAALPTAKNAMAMRSILQQSAPMSTNINPSTQEAINKLLGLGSVVAGGQGLLSIQ